MDSHFIDLFSLWLRSLSRSGPKHNVTVCEIMNESRYEIEYFGMNGDSGEEQTPENKSKEHRCFDFRFFETKIGYFFQSKK